MIFVLALRVYLSHTPHAGCGRDYTPSIFFWLLVSAPPVSKSITQLFKNPVSPPWILRNWFYISFQQSSVQHCRQQERCLLLYRESFYWHFLFYSLSTFRENPGHPISLQIVEPYNIFLCVQLWRNLFPVFAALHLSSICARSHYPLYSVCSSSYLSPLFCVWNCSDFFSLFAAPQTPHISTFMGLLSFLFSL